MQGPNFGLWPRRLLGAALLVVWLIVAGDAHVLAAPTAQNVATGQTAAGQHLYLTPAESSNVAVEVHIAELWVNAADAANFVDVDATYRLKNPDRDVAGPLLRLATASAEIGVSRLGHISNLSVTSGDQAVGLQETENGNYTFRVQVPADGRITLRLRYRVALGTDALASVRYTLEPLNRWAGEVSIRVEAKAPDAIPADSWTRIEPDGWSYGLATDPGRVDVKWLYNRRAPTAPIVFQFVNPSLWRQIRALELTPLANRSFEQYSRLGELYRQIYNAAGATPEVRDRFLAQSIAAFTGATRAPGGDDAQRGAIHYNLAQLYRAHAPFTGEQQANEYAQLMVGEVARALALLPAGDARRSEMGRWRADGLSLLLTQARAQAEWDQALAIVAELESLPPGSISPNFLEQERRDLLIQKALQLLEQGERDAAFAVAGPQLSGAQLEPPEQLQTLFLRWALTVTASPTRLDILAVGQTAPERHEQALAAGRNMVDLFGAGTTRRSSDVRATLTDDFWDGNPALSIHVSLPATGDAVFLANLTPATADWVLLRTLFGQLALQVNEEGGLIRRTITLRQPLDLRPAATQWQSMANTLERQAQDFETAATNAPQSQDALAARIRAVHHRAMADRWRTLATRSTLYFELRAAEHARDSFAPVAPALQENALATNPDATSLVEAPSTVTDLPAATARLAGAPPVRAWYLAVAAPSQVFTLQAQVLNLARLLTVMALALAGIVALSGLLWWLL